MRPVAAAQNETSITLNPLNPRNLVGGQFRRLSGRNEIDFDEWVRLDLAYIDDRSLKEDLRIMARTILAVASGRGAM